MKACQEWAIGSDEYIEYLQETLTGDDLNYVEDKTEDYPHLPWTGLAELLSERYNNLNRQIEVSDRFFSMKYEDFHLRGESQNCVHR